MTPHSRIDAALALSVTLLTAACQLDSSETRDAALADAGCASRDIMGVVIDLDAPCEGDRATVVVGCSMNAIHSADVGCYVSDVDATVVTTDALYPELREQGWADCSPEIHSAVIGVVCE